ncbi:MAG: transglutaminase-like domain-containing protein [Methanoregula sp.]|nr:transglutaminase-like domain-containing protein [Methanoregula sp.]
MCKEILRNITIVLLFSAIVILISGLIYPNYLVGTPYCLFICKNPSFQDNINEPNNFFNQRYITEIFPKGKEIISTEIETIKQINDSDSKLDEIFKWEMRDWHNPLWESDNFNYFNGSLIYISYKNNVSRTRANPVFGYYLYRPQTPEGKYYGDDPYWIAYNKVGACQELSNLFAFMAQKSGIRSRTVQTFGHQWAEVEINGEWKYYDPWCAVEHGYYNSTDGNLTSKDKWYNYPGYFRDNCHGLAYINFYNDIVPNPLATQVYSISYVIHDIKNLVTTYMTK